MKIHFVCNWNANRSRLAEAYLNSKEIPNLSATSSGIYATENPEGALSGVARKILTEDKIIQFASEAGQETTEELLEDSDLVIFMEDEQFEYCRDYLKCIPEKNIIWNVKDIAPSYDNNDLVAHADDERRIYNVITTQIDKLLETLNYEKD